MMEFKEGQRVRVSNDIFYSDSATNRLHTVVDNMREMAGKCYKVERSNGRDTVFLKHHSEDSSYMFHPDDLQIAKPVKKIKPAMFNPEALVCDD